MSSVRFKKTHFVSDISYLLEHVVHSLVPHKLRPFSSIKACVV